MTSPKPLYVKQYRRYPAHQEDVSIFINDIKKTTDVAKDLRHNIGRRTARKLYQKLNIMDNDTFDSVAWGDIRRTIDKTPKMYQLWYDDQCSGHC